MSLQALLGAFTQESRLLQLSTPLGSNRLIAECVRGEEGISQGFRFQLSALSADAAIALKSLLGQPVLLQLLTATSHVFSGKIKVCFLTESVMTCLFAVIGRQNCKGLKTQ